MNNCLLICISFHFQENRFFYLKKIIENFLQYKVKIKIIIETNSFETVNLIKENFKNEFEKTLFLKIHENLIHPHYLTWMHRKIMNENLENFSHFMYIEDDIFLPFENYQDYLIKLDYLWPNYIPSFVRLEQKDETYYNADAISVTKIKNKDILSINNKKFILLNNPYHGFWIMTQEILKKYKLPNFTIDQKWIRESAASYGLSPGNHPSACWKSPDIQKKGLVEIVDYKISSKCYSYHLPNNYINNNSKFGKIKLENIIKIQKFI
jgi:hypothetical protein